MPNKRAQAARRLRARLESQHKKAAEETKAMGKPLSWFLVAVFCVIALAVVADIVIGLWRRLIDILTGIPLPVMIIAVMVAAYCSRAIRGGKLKRKIQKLKAIEKRGE